MTDKNVDDLVPDIYKLLEEGKEELNEEALDNMMISIREEIASLIKNAGKEWGPSLRFSGLGKPLRQQWYEHKSGHKKKKFNGQTQLRMMTGHVMEAVILYLCEEAGHKISHQQFEVAAKGVKGHIDAIVNGNVLMDVKTASNYGFKKFAENDVKYSDFGYLQQLRGYKDTLGVEDAIFLALNKNTSELAIARPNLDDVPHVEERIETVKKVIESDEIPERCYELEPEGASGNMKLGANCSFCDFKKPCWEGYDNGKGLRAFKYGNGCVVHLAVIKREPRVEEVEVE